MWTHPPWEFRTRLLHQTTNDNSEKVLLYFKAINLPVFSPLHALQHGQWGKLRDSAALGGGVYKGWEQWWRQHWHQQNSTTWPTNWSTSTLTLQTSDISIQIFSDITVPMETWLVCFHYLSSSICHGGRRAPDIASMEVPRCPLTAS